VQAPEDCGDRDHLPEFPRRTVAVNYPKNVPESSSTSSVVEYLIGLNNHPRGPFSLEDLALLARSGVVNGQTRVMARGWEDWLPFADVPELAALLAVVPATRPEGAAADSGFPAEALQKISARFDQLQAGLLTLAKELEARTEGLKDGQKISVEAVADGQGAIQSTLAELRKGEAAHKETLARQLAELELRLAQSIRDQTASGQEAQRSRLDEVVRGLAAAGEAAALRHEQQSSEAQARVAGLVSALEKSQARVEAQIQEHAEILGREKQRLEAGLKEIDVRSQAGVESILERLQEAESRQAALEKKLEAGIEALGERLQTQVQQAAEAQALAKEASARAVAQLETTLAARLEKTEASTGSVLGQHIEQSKAALAAHQAVVEEHLRDLSDALADLKKSHAVEAEALTRRVADLESSSNKRADAFLQHISGWEAAWPQKLQPLLQEIQATPGRLDAQFGRLEQSVQSAVAEQQTALEKILAEAENNALERHSIFLAVADESRTVPERIHKEIEETFALARQDLEALRTDISPLAAQLREAQEKTADVLRQEQARLAARLEEMHRETEAREESAWKHWEEKHAALTSFVETLEGHLEKELASHLDRLQSVAQNEGLRVGQGVAKLGEELRTLQTGWQGWQKEVQEQHGALLAVLASSEKHTEAVLTRSEADVRKQFQSIQEDLRALSADGLRVAEETSILLRDGLAKISFEAIARGEEQLALSRQLAEGLQARQESVLQSVANLGAWSETLHDQIDAAQSSLADATAGLRTALEHSGRQQFEQLRDALSQIGKQTEERQKSLVDEGRALAAELSKQIHGETAGISQELVRQLDVVVSELRVRAGEEKTFRDQLSTSQLSALADLKESLSGFATEIRKRTESEVKARETTSSQLLGGLAETQTALARQQQAIQQAAAEQARTLSDNIRDQHQALSATLAGQHQALQESVGNLHQLVKEEIASGWAKRWTVLSADLAQIREAAVQRKQALSQELAELEARIPASITAEVHGGFASLTSRFEALESELAAQEARINEARAATEKEIALQFGLQQRLFDQIQQTLQKDVAEGFLGHVTRLQEDVERLRKESPDTRATLVQAIQDAVARLPDQLTESYRISNNELQQQIAELALEVGSASQLVEKSQQALDKVGVEQRAVMQEAAEYSRQHSASALRAAREEIQTFYGNILDQLKSWQAEQTKVISLATSLIADAQKNGQGGPTGPGDRDARDGLKLVPPAVSEAKNTIEKTKGVEPRGGSESKEGAPAPR
jgi:hypothetical protein